eukprot:SAG31_NODE_1737_length_7402_cov_28.696289_3_plen_99_part_00
MPAVAKEVPLPFADPGPFRLLIAAMHGDTDHLPLAGNFAVELLAVSRQFGVEELASDCKVKQNNITNGISPANPIVLCALARVLSKTADSVQFRRLCP